MAREVTPIFGWDTPVLGEEANVPADLKSLANDVETTIKALEPKYLKTAGAGDSAKLLIVDGTGAAAFKAMSGDATITNAGVISIGGEKITTAMLAALCVTNAKIALEAVGSTNLAALSVIATKLAAECVETGKIKNLAVTAEKLANEAVTEGKVADKAISSRKFNPTAGLKAATANKEMTEALQDITGCLLEITPATASILRVNLIICKAGGAASVEGALLVDGVAQEARAYITNVGEVAATAAQVYDIPLTAALHTIKLQCKRTNAGTATIMGVHTRFAYDLRSQ